MMSYRNACALTSNLCGARTEHLLLLSSKAKSHACSKPLLFLYAHCRLYVLSPFFRQVDLTHSLQTLVRITTALARAAVQQRRGVGARGTHIAISHLLRSAFTHHEHMARPHRGDLTTDGRA